MGGFRARTEDTHTHRVTGSQTQRKSLGTLHRMVRKMRIQLEEAFPEYFPEAQQPPVQPTVLRTSERVRDRHYDYRAASRDAVLEAYGGCCARCGHDDPLTLQIDHIHGGGMADRAQYGGPTAVKFYQAVLDDRLLPEPKYQLLCSNCNWGKWRIIQHLERA